MKIFKFVFLSNLIKSLDLIFRLFSIHITHILREALAIYSSRNSCSRDRESSQIPKFFKTKDLANSFAFFIKVGLGFFIKNKSIMLSFLAKKSSKNLLNESTSFEFIKSKILGAKLLTSSKKSFSNSFKRKYISSKY